MEFSFHSLQLTMTVSSITVEFFFTLRRLTTEVFRNEVSCVYNFQMVQGKSQVYLCVCMCVLCLCIQREGNWVKCI